MNTYANLSGHSGISAYEIGPGYVSVKFKSTGAIYTYSYGRAGKANVDYMKRLATGGSGLNSFIMRTVKNLYD